MSSIAETTETNVYYRPSSDGKITNKITKEEYEQRIAADTPDNVRSRDWTIQATGESGTTYEEYHTRVRGRIVGIAIREHEKYGRSIALTLRTEDGAEGVFTVSTDGQYGMSLMERLPNVDFDQEVTISPWAKEVGDSKRYTLFLDQNNEKVNSKFKSYDADKKEWTQYEGYPEVDEKEKKKYGEKYWSKRYYPECAVFLVEYIEEHVMPKVNTTEVVEEKNDVEVVPDESF